MPLILAAASFWCSCFDGASVPIVGRALLRLYSRWPPMFLFSLNVFSLLNMSCCASLFGGLVDLLVRIFCISWEVSE